MSLIRGLVMIGIFLDLGVFGPLRHTDLGLSSSRRAHFDELSAKVDNLPTRVQFDQLLASIANLNTEVDRLPTSSQFDRLTDKIDHLTYNTKACCCDEKRTDKGTALLSLKDRDGVMVNTNQTSQLCSIGKPPLHPSLPTPFPSQSTTSDQSLIT
jgi:hypothetical protein